MEARTVRGVNRGRPAGTHWKMPVSCFSVPVMPRVRPPFLHLPLLLLAGLLPAQAAPLEQAPEFQAARRALAEGLPGVAAIKAARLLEGRDWSTADRQQLAVFAVEAWLRAHDGRAALAVLAKETLPDEGFWEAQARLLAGEPAAAEQILQARLAQGQASEPERLLLAQVALAQGHTAQAQEVLTPLRSASSASTARRARLMLAELALVTGNAAAALDDLQPRPGRLNALSELLRARALVELGRHAEAEPLLLARLASNGGGERVHHAAATLLAESRLQQGQAVPAMEALVQLLDNTPDSEEWSAAFDLLARALAAKPGETLPPDATLRWISEGNTAQRQALQPLAATETFRGHAMLLLARWLLSQQRTSEALGMLEAMIQVHPDHPQAEEAMRLALETYGTLKVDSRVTALANQWRRRFGSGSSSMVDFVTGSTAFARGEPARAAGLFQAAAQVATTLGERRAALYNAGVAALRAGEMALYQALLGQLQIVSAGADSVVKSGDSAADLELDQALDLAARAQPEAAEQLRRFIDQHAGHPRVLQARLALAELALLKKPADVKTAQTLLDEAGTQPNLSAAQRQSLAVTRLWLLERQGQLRALAEAGAEFLTAWPDAPQAVLVRMKVADAFFRLENFASARTEFELVAKEHPESAYADTALYFAGLSALSVLSDEGREAAISLWQELAERGGPLSMAARQQQALAKRRAGQETEALSLIESLLSEKNLTETMRRSLVCEKAELLMLIGKTDATRYGKAAEVLQALLQEDDLSYLWKARAGYTLAAALQAAGRHPEALEACYNVVQTAGSVGPSNPAEFRWYYRAGFFGIDLLEAAKQWETAAVLAETLARSRGERAGEAKERATKIRLDHFLWDEP